MAHYFTYFPQMLYDAVQDGTTSPVLVTNILRRVKVKDSIKDDVALFDKYRVKAGESPEMVSMRFYGTVDYYWVVLLMNDIKDRFYEWPLSEQDFESFVKEKYTNPQATRHFEITQSSGKTSSIDYSHFIEVNSNEPGATAVSFYEYERRKQDNMSLIKILKPDFVSAFVEEFAKSVR